MTETTKTETKKSFSEELSDTFEAIKEHPYRYGAVAVAGAAFRGRQIQNAVKSELGGAALKKVNDATFMGNVPFLNIAVK